MVTLHHETILLLPASSFVSVAARGAAGASPCCPPMVAMTATKDDRRTQLALWVGGQGEIQFAMGNERGKGVIMEAGQFQEGVWTHLAVSMEGRKVRVEP